MRNYKEESDVESNMYVSNIFEQKKRKTKHEELLSPD
jgi:hypothetical protein